LEARKYVILKYYDVAAELQGDL